MIADLGARRFLHLAQKRVHLLGPQAPAGADRTVAGHGGEHMIELALERGGGSPFLEAVDEVRDQLTKLPRGRAPWRFANGDRAGTEGLDERPSSSRSFACSRSLAQSEGSRSTISGVSMICRSTPRVDLFPLQPLVDEALMGGMLIDDDETVSRLRDDVILMQLGARSAKRKGFASAARVGSGACGSTAPEGREA